MDKKAVRAIIAIALIEGLLLAGYILYNILVLGRLDQTKLLYFVIIVCGLASFAVLAVILNSIRKKQADEKKGHE